MAKHFLWFILNNILVCDSILRKKTITQENKHKTNMDTVDFMHIYGDLRRKLANRCSRSAK